MQKLWEIYHQEVHNYKIGFNEINLLQLVQTEIIGQLSIIQHFNLIFQMFNYLGPIGMRLGVEKIPQSVNS